MNDRTDALAPMPEARGVIIKIAIIIGSTRLGRNGESVARWVYEIARKRGDAAFELVDLKDFDLPLLDEPLPAVAALGQYAHPHTRAWAATIASFDGYVFVTPEYNHGAPGALKNAIDFLYTEWNNKAAGFVGYSAAGGAGVAVASLRLVMGELQVADVRAQVALSLFTDFENFSTFKPAPHHGASVDAMLDQVTAWGGALKNLRKKGDVGVMNDKDHKDVERETVIRWISRQAHSLTTLDPHAPLTDLRPLRHMAPNATVVGLGGSTRGAHELCAIQHRVLRFLVEEMGFRSLALEEDWTKGIQLDEYVRTGSGDPRAVLSDARPFTRIEEVLAAIRWMRSYNQQHPADPLRVVGVDITAVRALAYDAVADDVRRTAPQRLDELKAHYAELRPSAGIAVHIEWCRNQQDKQPLIDHARQAYDLVADLPAHDGHALALQHARVIVAFYEYHALDSLASRGYAERRLAENTIWWHNHIGDKVVYWGGMAHTTNGNPRAVSSPPSPPATDRSAGSYLRDHFGPGYVSVALTFHHGSAPYPVPAPSLKFADAVLGGVGLDAYVLDLHARQPQAVRAWLNAPAKTRLIGPHYDPEDDPAYHMSGGSLADWFDLIIHSQEATPIRLLA